jgi:hypothetical protein
MDDKSTMKSTLLLLTTRKQTMKVSAKTLVKLLLRPFLELLESSFIQTNSMSKRESTQSQSRLLTERMLPPLLKLTSKPPMLETLTLLISLSASTSLIKMLNSSTLLSTSLRPPTQPTTCKELPKLLWELLLSSKA